MTYVTNFYLLLSVSLSSVTPKVISYADIIVYANYAFDLALCLTRSDKNLLN